MHLLAISGSPSSPSINHTLLQYALTLAPQDTTTELLSIRDLNAPFYSSNEENDNGVPQAIQTLLAKIKAADVVVLASPEYNSGAPAMLKNTSDWLSRIERSWLPRPLAILSTSPGGRGGASNLASLAGLSQWWGAQLVGTFSLPSFNEAWDAQTQSLRDPEQALTLRGLMQSLHDAAPNGPEQHA